MQIEICVSSIRHVFKLYMISFSSCASLSFVWEYNGLLQRFCRQARRHLDMSFVALVVTSVLVGADVAISDYRFGRIAGRSEFLWEWCSRLHLFQKAMHVLLAVENMFCKICIII